MNPSKNNLSARPMMVNCSGCRTPLQLPSGGRAIRCALCKAVTHIAASPGIQAPLSSQRPHPHGKKRAVIIGVSYFNSPSPLKSCLKDAKCMQHLLINKLKFPSDSIIMLTEEETHPSHIPTKQNIRMALYWLVKEGCTSGDSLLFYFAGHGSRQNNYNGDEVDGYDERLCPLDFKTEGEILDDEINATIVRPLPHGAKLHSIIDACRSGTVMDLPYLCRMNKDGQYVWENHQPKSGVWKGTAGGEVIAISGCDDDQLSDDTQALSMVTATGAMTFCFIQAIERSGAQGITYGSIMNSMRTTIRNTRIKLGGGFVTTMVNMITGNRKLKQEPQLTASEPFDIYAKLFSL
ncbi:hypothetical protein AALP_AA6G337100 [Arabis alpina]|uniref:Uncharacterized protein n=1 Tax=Arabis alpina TaxID=50452 RepID=A0A087GTE6_ARAAL|nr:hypothetical protein AALP_AA6G337100 [Arabis alpina]